MKTVNILVKDFKQEGELSGGEIAITELQNSVNKIKFEPSENLIPMADYTNIKKVYALAMLTCRDIFHMATLKLSELHDDLPNATHNVLRMAVINYNIWSDFVTSVMDNFRTPNPPEYISSCPRDVTRKSLNNSVSILHQQFQIITKWSKYLGYHSAAILKAYNNTFVNQLKAFVYDIFRLVGLDSPYRDPPISGVDRNDICIVAILNVNSALYASIIS